MQPPPQTSMPADWQMIGSLADWSTAGIALLAFVIAAVAARATLKTNNAQQAQLAMQIDQQKYAQAAQVTFWADEDQSTIQSLSIVNASSLPVYRAALIETRSERYRCVWFRRVLRPTGSKVDIVQIDEPIKTPIGPMILGFQDSGGQYWTRDGWGKLKPVDDSDLWEGGIEKAIARYFGGLIPGEDVIPWHEGTDS